MPARLLFAADLPTGLREALGYRDVSDALRDQRGVVVRDIPHRRTSRLELGDWQIYRKLRRGQAGQATREWQWLHRLGECGLQVPRPVFLAVDGSNSAVGMFAVPGRSVLELLRERGDPDDQTRRFVIEAIAPRVRALHGAGLVHRDLYWNHWFSESLDPARAQPVLIDLERVFRPRWRRRRWLVKDLAGLVSSWPLPPAPGLALRFLRVYQGGELSVDWKRIARDVLRKAARIRAHAPKWG